MSNPWKILAEINTMIAANRQDARRELIRALDFSKNDTSSWAKYRPILMEMCDRVGLYPYLDDTDLTSSPAQLRTQIHATGFGRENVANVPRLHEEQLHNLEQLLRGKNIALFAPTSYGKTTLIAEFLRLKSFGVVVIIVPTIALMDELRRRLARDLRSYSVSVEHVGFVPEEGRNKLYILTQERYLENSSEIIPDFFVIDEFYQISDNYEPKRKRSYRAESLNIAFNRLRSTNAQYLLLGPPVASFTQTAKQSLASIAVHSDFETVAIVDEWVKSDRKADLKLRVNDEGQYPLLVYFRGPTSMCKVLYELPRLRSAPVVNDYLNWIKLFYPMGASFVEGMRKGYGVHYGPLPGSLRRIMVRLFNEGHISVLLCTSTLAEGVNTVAKTVVMYDKKVSNANLDSVAVMNIRGRAGRMGRYLVGKFVHYDDIAAVKPTVMDLPIDSFDGSSTSSERFERFGEKALGEHDQDFDREGYKKALSDFPGLRVEQLNEIISALSDLRDRGEIGKLEWHGEPVLARLNFLFEFLSTLDFFNSNITRLNKARFGPQSLRLFDCIKSTDAERAERPFNEDFILHFCEGQTSYGLSLDDSLKFIHVQMKFDIPTALTRASRLFRLIGDRGWVDGFSATDLSYDHFAKMCATLSTGIDLFRLEELGLPVPLTLRLANWGVDFVSNESLEQLLISVRHQFVDLLSEVEDEILDDVIEGL